MGLRTKGHAQCLTSLYESAAAQASAHSQKDEEIGEIEGD